MSAGLMCKALLKEGSGFIELRGEDYADKTAQLRHFHDDVKSRLVKHVGKHPNGAVVLFDEAQKAVPGVLDVLLPALSMEQPHMTHKINGEYRTETFENVRRVCSHACLSPAAHPPTVAPGGVHHHLRYRRGQYPTAGGGQPRCFRRVIPKHSFQAYPQGAARPLGRHQDRRAYSASCGVPAAGAGSVAGSRVHAPAVAWQEEDWQVRGLLQLWVCAVHHRTCTGGRSSRSQTMSAAC